MKKRRGREEKGQGREGDRLVIRQRTCMSSSIARRDDGRADHTAESPPLNLLPVYGRRSPSAELPTW